MKILVILSRIPWPLEKGDKLRAYHQLRCLSRDNEIILFALNDKKDLNITEARQQLMRFCAEVHFFRLKKPLILWNMIKAFFKGEPIQVGYFYSCKAKKLLMKLYSRVCPDHIYCQLIRTAEYGRIFDISKTIDYQDALSQGLYRRSIEAPILIRWLFKMEYRRLRRYEGKVFDWFDNKTIISEPDRNLLGHPEREKVVIVPNGIDQEYFSPIEAEKKFDIIFNGNMSYPPNIKAAEMLVKKILPVVHQTYPDTTLLLSGAHPHPRVLALEGDKVAVSGWVDDIRDNYAASRIFVAPMQIGTGLQNKLLEAMCMELPCITSSLANASLKALPGKEILIGDTPESFAEQIIFLRSSPDEATVLAQNGREFVLKNFDWSRATAILESLITTTPYKK